MMGAAMLKRHQFVQSLWALYRLVVSSITLFATCMWGSQAQPLFKYKLSYRKWCHYRPGVSSRESVCDGVSGCEQISALPHSCPLAAAMLNQSLSVNLLLYTSGPVSLNERLLYTLNKPFVKQVKSFHLLLDLDPFIVLCSLHNIKYIKFTSLQDISIKVMQIHNSLLPS